MFIKHQLILGTLKVKLISDLISVNKNFQKHGFY